MRAGRYQQSKRKQLQARLTKTPYRRISSGLTARDEMRHAYEAKPLAHCQDDVMKMRTMKQIQCLFKAASRHGQNVILSREIAHRRRRSYRRGVVMLTLK